MRLPCALLLLSLLAPALAVSLERPVGVASMPCCRVGATAGACALQCARGLYRLKDCAPHRQPPASVPAPPAVLAEPAWSAASWSWEPLLPGTEPTGDTLWPRPPVPPPRA